jgi:hypothetical protein
MDIGNHYLWWLGRSLGLEGLIMLDQFKDYFRLPSAKELAAKELEMAQRKLLEALSAQEYAKRMGDYHSDRIKRLTAYLKEEA